MLKNEIFYSLSKHEIYAIKEKILRKINSQYLNILITFSQEELNSIYKLLSNLYTIENKEEIEGEIWETFICNKIIEEIDKKELIYYQHDLKKETKILNSYDLELFIEIRNNRSNITRISQIIKNQISKNVIVHYFQDDIIIPIGLQKIINCILTKRLSFINVLYTTRSSLNSYYMRSGYWTRKKGSDIEIWKLIPPI